MTKHKEAIVGQDGKPSNHGTDIVQDRGMKHGTKVQEVKMAGALSGNRFAYGRSDVNDSINKSKAKK